MVRSGCKPDGAKMLLPLVVAIGFVVSTALVLLLSVHVLYPEGSLVKRAELHFWQGEPGCQDLQLHQPVKVVVPEGELGGDGPNGPGGPEFVEQPGFAINHGFSAEITAAPSPYLKAEDMSLLR